MEEDLLALESDIKLKIEHAFDVKHIYDIFATLIAGMKHQQEQIRDLNTTIKISNAKIQDMETNIENMEYNIQGFGSEDEFTDDEGSSPLKRTGSLRSMGSRPRLLRKQSSERREKRTENPLNTTREEPKEREAEKLVEEESVTEGSQQADPMKEAVPMEESGPNPDEVEATKETVVEDKQGGSEEMVGPVDAIQMDAVPESRMETPSDQTDTGVAAEKLSKKRTSRTPEQEREWNAKKKRILKLMYVNVRAIGRLRRGAMSVAKSKLDPKLSVNNRIKGLEDGLAALKELVGSHRQALDSIPNVIKKIVPADLNSQLSRLGAMMDNLEAIQDSIKATAEERAPPVQMVVEEKGGEPSQNDAQLVTVDMLGNLPADMLAAIAEQVAERIGSISAATTPASEIPPPMSITADDILSDDNLIKQLSLKMLQGGHLDELKPNPSSSSRRLFSGRKSRGGTGEAKLSVEEQQEEEEELEAFKEHTTEVVKDLTNHLVSRDEIASMLDIEVTPMFSAPSSPVDVSKRSPVVRTATMPPSRAESLEESFRGPGNEFAIKLKTVMEQQIQNLTINTLSKDEFESRIRSLETYVNIEFSKAAKEGKEALASATNPLRDRVSKVERQLNDMSILLSSLEAMARAQASEARRVDSDSNADAWRPELEKMNAALQESLRDQRDIATALLKDLERLQAEIANRVDAQRLQELVNELDDKISTGLERGMDPMMNSIAHVVRAVKGKADRVEVQRVIAARIAETEENLKRIEAEDAAAAGVFRCISCGKRPPSPNHVTDRIEAFQSSISSWGGDAVGDFEQVVAVMHRKAGLKSLTRHTKPMLPANRPSTTTAAPAPYHKTPKFPAEPLYRRAKVAAQIKEMPKKPLITFGPSHANPSGVYQLDPSARDGGGFVATEPVGQGGSGVKLPQLPASAPKMSQSMSAANGL